MELKGVETGILKGHYGEFKAMEEHKIPLEYHDRLEVARRGFRIRN